jgi:hypothetical protein
MQMAVTDGHPYHLVMKSAGIVALSGRAIGVADETEGDVKVVGSRQ